MISGKWLIPLAPADQSLVGGGLEGEAEAEKSPITAGRIRPGPLPSISTAPARSSLPPFDHRPAQLAEQEPGRLVGAEPELEPQLPGGDAILVRRHQPGGQEPGAQAEVAAVQHR